MEKVTIRTIEALEILDSRGDPTVQARVILTDGTHAEASVPSGASTGMYEAFELRDGDRSRFGGKGVSKAVRHIMTEIRDALIGHDPFDQKAIDAVLIALDGTENKQRLGANAILGVSLAVARAAAISAERPLYAYIRSLTTTRTSGYCLPVPLINVVNGGKHASSNLNLQEFWVVPHRALEFRERLRQGSEIFHVLGQLLTENGQDTDLGNEGGYAPDFESHEAVVRLIMRAIERAGFTAGADISLGLDAGSSVLFDTSSNRYELPLDDVSFTSEQMIAYYMHLVEQYPFAALEDPLAEEEWLGWQELTVKLKAYNPEIRLIGDDLFVTNKSRLRKGIDLSVANTVLIKPNQIGTLTETLDCIELAHENGYATAVSHRSGETTDSFIADLAVAVNSEFIKTGSTARGERMAKYNRLLEIEHALEQEKY